MAIAGRHQLLDRCRSGTSYPAAPPRIRGRGNPIQGTSFHRGLCHHSSRRPARRSAALRSHFLEFLPANSDQTKLVHELTIAQRYQVVITTGGGLYRYRTGDWVQVTGQLQRCPLVRFVGRDATTDLVGEKLSDQFVGAALQRLLGETDAPVSFALLVPDVDRCRYRLFMQTSKHLHPSVSIDELSGRLDQLLSENPYYRQARELGQLPAPQLVVDSSAEHALQALYTSIAIFHGSRPGSLKPVALETNADRAKDFIGRWEDSDARKAGPTTSR